MEWLCPCHRPRRDYNRHAREIENFALHVADLEYVDAEAMCGKVVKRTDAPYSRGALERGYGIATRVEWDRLCGC